MFRIATYNIRYDNPGDGAHSWPHRRFATLKCIADLKCDVLGLQEVLPHQRAFLQQRLTGFQWYGVGRTDGRQSGEQSPLVIRDGIVGDLEWHTVWLSATPHIVGSTGVDARIPRIATVVRGTWSEHPVGIINTHFDHRGVAARLAAAEQVAQMVGSESRAWIVCGDLNVGPADEVVDVLRGAGLRSALPAAHGTFHKFRGDTEGQQIDYVLVDQSWLIEGARIETARPLGIVPSDHWPVVVDLRLAHSVNGVRGGS